MSSAQIAAILYYMNISVERVTRSVQISSAILDGVIQWQKRN